MHPIRSLLRQMPSVSDLAVVVVALLLCSHAATAMPIDSAPMQRAASAMRPVAVPGGSSAGETPPDEQIRVAVGRFRDKLVITGDGVLVQQADGTRSAPSSMVTIALKKGALFVGDDPAHGDVVRVLSDGALQLAGHSYRHELEVSLQLYDNKTPELLVVHPLDLEAYVVGIVSSEMPKGWQPAAYEAQAIAARSYAVWQKFRRLDLPYHMEASVLDQVYGGAEREHPLAVDAAASTRGIILTFQHHVVQAYFHSTCGGKTESAREGWGSSLPYLPGGACGACSGSNRSRWTARVVRREVDAAFARFLAEPVAKISITARTASGRVRSVVVEGKRKKKTISGADLRRLLGFSRVLSTAIDSITWEKNTLVVQGRGSGHGVGLCQWGAEGLAEDGVSSSDILARYYPGAELKKLY